MRLRKSRYLTALATAVASTALLAPSAHADFENFGTECDGSNIQGQGATFQNNAQIAWRAGFTMGTPGLAVAVCPNFRFPTTAPAQVNYTQSGSGAGRNALQSRGPDRFAGTDEAPSTSQEMAIENGAAGAQDDGNLRTLPITAGGITISVNFPDGCTIPSGARFRPNADGTTRFLSQNVDLEAVFYGEFTTWDDLVPGIGGAGCATKPIRRVVRTESSGTTFAFKTWLSEINPNRNPSWQFYRGQNIVWPNDEGATKTIRGLGNDGVAQQVRANDGTIGYVDLATARDEGFDKTGRRSSLTGTDTSPADDTTYWIPVANGAGQFRDPTQGANSYREPFASAVRGAQCGNVTYTGVPGGPDPTLGNWNATEGVNSPTGYGICALTYALTFEDYCDAYPQTTNEGRLAEEAKARSVFDYEGYVLGSAGQEVARRADYSLLPASLRAIAENGNNNEPWRRPGNAGSGNPGSCS